ncbi:pancreatic secretory granule membrane major glycoprotein GP2-like [Pseudophryne corroboree]|uniref:pancreatic secretory granule membrane major glycoprotein GP2-like n=1 Tax=Pseudophryne corroboree TaxID=495146 RepID=UPI0030814FD9
MKATFQKCQLKSLKLNASSITLKDSSCFGLHHEPVMNTFSIISPLKAGECGLQITKNSTHAMYENTLDFIIKSVGVIERREELILKISCAYPLDMLTSLYTVVNPFFSSTNIYIDGVGEFKAYMALYIDSTYVIPYQGSNVSLSTSDFLYAGVFVLGGDDSRFLLVMNSCYATPTESPDDSLRYYLIIDSCPNKEDATIHILENGVSRKGRFSVQVFKFPGNYNNVYLHCAISLCDKADGSCEPSCSRARDQKAASGQSYQMTLGPIISGDIPIPTVDPHTTSVPLCEADEEWKLKDDIYGCYCKEKYEVSAVADIKPELTCGVYEMKATFQKCQLKSLNLNASSITLKNSSCFGLHHEPIMNTFSIISPLQAGECGLQITKNSTHAMYENTLDFIIESVGVIERREELILKISCAYPLDMLTSLYTVVNPFFSSTNIYIDGVGEFKAYMALYIDSNYVIPYQGSNVSLSTSDFLYAGVFVLGGDDSRFLLVMRNCYATPTESPDDSVRYYLIIDSCPNKEDPTIHILENGVSRKGRFSVQVFKFVGNYNKVYLHCAISLCDKAEGSCEPSCSEARSQKAASDQSYQMTLGPIIRGDTPTPTVVSPSTTSGSIGTRPTCALLGLVLFLLAKMQLF